MTLNYFPLQLGPMQESGSTLLRAIQNDSMIQLDLLVREAVQNSLDAAIRPATGPVSVDFSLRMHTTEAIYSVLGSGIDHDVMRRRFPEGGTMLEVRDSGTEGLSGPLRLEDIERGQVRGNLLKLVYEVGRSRTDDASGGSWGLGKTCYFRVGAGLVLYYSRIRVGREFAERLVACLVEDEEDHDRLQRTSGTGIAWWGGDAGAPLTDVATIARHLAMLGVRPFTGQETGTAIVIPFLRDDLIPPTEEDAGDDPEALTGHGPRPWWFADYKSYLTVALQRWFCARIDNPRFRGGPVLTPSVNGQPVRATAMLPVFRVMQALYNRLDTGAGDTGDYLAEQGVAESAIFTGTITLNSVFRGGSSAGKIVACRLSPAQLRMLPPSNQAEPHTCIFSRHDQISRERPLVAFMRCPGMVIRWDNSGDARSWGGGTLLRADEGFLVALFVPDTDRQMSEAVCLRLRSPGATLESYLRACERADHHQWNDQAGFTIISRIRAKVGKYIREFGAVAPTVAAPATSLRIARNLADRLLPPGFGQDGRIPPAPRTRGTQNSGTGRGRSRRNSGPDLEITSVRYAERGVRIAWALEWGTGQEPRQISLSIDSESGRISPEAWQADRLGPYPLQLVAAALTSDAGGAARDALKHHDTNLRICPWQAQMDGVVIGGEITILFTGEIGGNLRPVLQVDRLLTTEVRP